MYELVSDMYVGINPRLKCRATARAGVIDLSIRHVFICESWGYHQVH